MSLLGPSLHTLNQRHLDGARSDSSASASAEGLPHLGAYARGMLAALEGLHAQVGGQLRVGAGHHACGPALAQPGPCSGCPPARCPPSLHPHRRATCTTTSSPPTFVWS